MQCTFNSSGELFRGSQIQFYPSHHPHHSRIDRSEEKAPSSSHMDPAMDATEETKSSRPKFGNRFLTDESRVFDCNAWDDVQWDPEQEKLALEQIAEQLRHKLPDEEADRLEAGAAENWNKFYQTHKTDFFKDRHWLLTEFEELKSDSDISIFELGCGVGNALFPLLDAVKNLTIYACDFSSTAIDLFKSNPNYNPDRMNAFVQDATVEWNCPFGESSLDAILLIFCLSAIDPSKHKHVIDQAFKYLKPGGLLLFRDYGRFDMAQLRFKNGKCINNNFYVRGDGTRAYFFEEKELDTLLTDSGFEKVELYTDRRLQVNRTRKLKMYRIWIQAKYRRPAWSFMQFLHRKN